MAGRRPVEPRPRLHPLQPAQGAERRRARPRYRAARPALPPAPRSMDGSLRPPGPAHRRPHARGPDDRSGPRDECDTAPLPSGRPDSPRRIYVILSGPIALVTRGCPAIGRQRLLRDRRRRAQRRGLCPADRAGFPADPDAEAELLAGFPFLEVQIVRESAFAVLTESFF